MAGDKRTKPCGNCKRSKVKCEYHKTLPCIRCLNSGLASSCLFVLKLPSLKLPLLNAHHVAVSYPNTPPPIQQIITPIPQIPLHNVHSIPKHSIYSHSQSSALPVAPVPNSTVQYSPNTAQESQSSFVKLEQKVENMDSKFNELLKLLHDNQTALQADRVRSQARTQSQSYPVREDPVEKNKRSFIESEPYSDEISKRSRISDDFRDQVITLAEAQLLFNFFDQNISQQLFGFELKSFCVEELWVSSPILICAICTISLIHYPDANLSSRQPFLQQHLHKLCTKIFFDSKQRSENQVFNTIVALILCSFWLADSQRFTGLALQLAKEHNFNEIKPKSSTKPSSLSHKDRLKLWYLLYILDGQQSMTFRRQALLPSDDVALQNSRLLLLDSDKKLLPLEDDSEKELPVSRASQDRNTRSTNFSDLRLVSQVEYNCALEEALKGNAWDLIDPSAFGIPSKSNLELDKWMVSWTVLLAPMNNGNVWLSKSTLIYYNFAKMHINSMALRPLQTESGGIIRFPKWNQYKFKSSASNSMASKGESGMLQRRLQECNKNGEEFILNTELASHDQGMLNLNIAISAAQTVLGLVLDDRDILDNLKYVPVHIHVMLYYAAFLLVSAPANMFNGGVEDESHFRSVFNHLKMIRTLQKKIMLNLPTDQVFGERFLQSLDNLFDERIGNLQLEIESALLEIAVKEDLKKEMSTLQHTYSKIDLIPESAEVSSSDSSPPLEKIYAWPASHHGHI